MRLKIFNLGVACIFLFLFFGLFNLNVIQGAKYKELSKKNSIRLFPQEGSRGRILDRQGNIIVANQIRYDVMIVPQKNQQTDKILMDVSNILGVAFKDLKDKFKNGFVALSIPITIAKNIEAKKAIAIEELKLDLPGVVIQTQPQRSYPYGKLACHIVGYLNEIDNWRLTKLADYGYKTKDTVGFGGVEERYDYYLHQRQGGLSVEIDHRGRFVRALGFRLPQAGKDIQLTIDLKIQKIVEENLEGRAGSIIIMDPYSGEIIAMASQPNFDPSVFINKPGSSISDIFNDSDAPLINRAISGVYPPGSVFKLVVATAALETGKINSSSTFLCQGSLHVGKQKFACWNTHDRQNLVAAITHSCNVFFYRTGLLLGAVLIHDYALKFGFGKPTSIDVPYEVGGFVPSPLWKKIYRFKSWFDGDTANFSIGQGDLLVTPLQMTRLVAVFANGGNLVTPYLVKKIDGRGISSYDKKIVSFPIKASTLGYIREGLKGVVSEPTGTASILADLGVSVAGKTGTAQAPPGQSHAWFVGFFPFKNPKFVICVFLERGGAGYAASMLAKQIIEEMVKESLV